MTRLCYVMGRGHSGTTALDLFLSTNSQLTSLGELSSGLRRVNDEFCSCGSQFKDCLSWPLSTFESVEELTRLAELSTRFDRIECLFIPLASSESKEYSTLLLEMYSEVTRLRGATGAIDSSKEISKGFRLLSCSKTAKVIYLRRSLLGVLCSYQERFVQYGTFNFRRKKRAGYSLTRVLVTVVLGQILADIIFLIFKLRFPSRIRRVSYEQLSSDEYVLEVFQYLNFDTESVDRHLKSAHIVGGNRMARSGGKAFFSPEVPRAERVMKLPFVMRLVARVVDSMCCYNPRK